jgi:predicted HicB family RNase H-like nuclease
MLHYKGFTGRFWIDDDAGVIRGRVVGIADVITFQGKTIREVTGEFANSIDVYLEWCAETGPA